MDEDEEEDSFTLVTDDELPAELPVVAFCGFLKTVRATRLPPSIMTNIPRIAITVPTDAKRF